ncbi:STAS domain-containing protein [Nonomuraea lactucae]|uniref:STAS domain-containing protein n=1 Tax=Nonomuraea lactucae TaxID=2249762 RepID=UPI0013B388FC|nr:STAS domain-containing protein [Nonomuraea lactucae]
MDQANGRRPGFSSAISRQGGVTVVRLSGELDIATAAELRLAMIEAVSAAGPPRVVIDVEAVDFCDSTGLSLIVAAMNGAEVAGGRMVLSGVRSRMARVLAMTGLDRRFEVHGTSADAVRELRSA